MAAGRGNRGRGREGGRQAGILTLFQLLDETMLGGKWSPSSLV
jgi:hypothetical protein